MTAMDGYSEECNLASFLKPPSRLSQSSHEGVSVVEIIMHFG